MSDTTDDPDETAIAAVVTRTCANCHVDPADLDYVSFGGVRGRNDDTVCLDGDYTWQQLGAIAACLVNVGALYTANA
jgi:hypothetical protein